MSEHDVIDIKNALKAKQLIESFDQNLARLMTHGADENEVEAYTIDLLSEWLEEAIENGVNPQELSKRANQLAQFAFSRGYSQHEVEELLTMRPNPNGKRPI
ncbi:hypothetical protein THMIRHAM_22340 [Thiomicrorhabdus immobilis]|uniref:Uncharacterized protein n=1 Tax=Thiomicrorhabdus immobilis TaxID=2791037 RepID=A0ABM7MG08_9GAMM|nr:hypothetical protein [Thiomicrorhabdus immobilis]BCN94449.1 hypothetical protein THMIRHAM_22340 [Thiomicrorhabdus immobilis]